MTLSSILDETNEELDDVKSQLGIAIEALRKIKSLTAVGIRKPFDYEEIATEALSKIGVK